jgi:hypothetical protein
MNIYIHCFLQNFRFSCFQLAVISKDTLNLSLQSYYYLFIGFFFIVAIKITYLSVFRLEFLLFGKKSLKSPIMSRFKWLGGIIPFAFGLVFVIYLIVLTIFFRSKRDKRVDSQQSASRTAFQLYFYGMSFENVYQSPWGPNRSGNWCIYLLLLWRVACFGFFFGNDMIWGLIHNSGNSAVYFTNWNVYLISLYYFLASVASVIGVWNDNSFWEHLLQQQQSHNHDNIQNRENLSFWAISTTKFGMAVHILFEIAGSTAFFITVIAFSALNPHFVYWNVSQHFVTTMSFLVELFLNNMLIRWEHVLFTVTWGLIYLIFIWPMVATGAATEWPYFFLDTDSVTVFGWYIMLFVALIFFYYVFYGVGALKWAIVGRKPHIYESLPLSQQHLQQRGNLLSVAADPEPKFNNFV